jgi:uncharacterized membrane protein
MLNRVKQICYNNIVNTESETERSIFMKRASEFRAIARNALCGKWGIAVLAGFLAALLGSAGGSGGVNIKTDGSGSAPTVDLGSLIPVQLRGVLAGAIVGVVLVGIAVLIGWIILSSVVYTGYCRFNLQLIDREEASINTMFSYFPHWKTVTIAHLLQGLYIFLWSLLFVIPGIVASFSYAMTGYILAEHPELSASEAIERSKEMMEGNRWRLFCLEISFLGWGLLAALTLGIGNLWLRPYVQASYAAFYREVSGTECYYTASEPVME